MRKAILISLVTVAGLALAGFLFYSVRQMVVNRLIQREWEAAPGAAPRLETTARLEIIPLYEEASAGAEWISGHGVSYLIRTDTATVLMDAGNNPDRLAAAPFAQNMQALGLDAAEIDAILITHPHPDHLGGVEAWKGKTVSFGETFTISADTPIYVPTGRSFPGAVVSVDPTRISPDMGTTGVISYLEVFPLSLYEPKGIEQALVVNVAGEGLVLITGCGHPTIERLLERVEALYHLPVVGIVGGLHYEGFSTQDVQPHIETLLSLQPRLVALSAHDSSPQALEAFGSTFGDRYRTLRVGETIQFP